MEINPKIARLGLVGASAIAATFLMPFEGESLHAYFDPPGIATICDGHTKNVKITDKATPQECIIYLGDDTKDAERGVDRVLKVKVSDKTKAAYISFAFNAGAGTFAHSSILRAANAGHIVESCGYFPLYVCAHVKPGTGAAAHTLCGSKTKSYEPLPGLVRRRAAEKALCIEGLK